MRGDDSRKKTAEMSFEQRFAVEITICPDKSFCEILSEAIDEAFSTLGESVKASIYYHLDNSLGLKRQEIPLRMEYFQIAIERVFGIGARHLEILIIKAIHEKLIVNCKWQMPDWVAPDITFYDYVQEVKKAYEKPIPYPD